MAEQKRLGELLKEEGAITDELLELALKEQKHTGEMLGEVLLRLGFVSENVLLKALARQMGEDEESERYQVDEEIVKKLPKEYALRFSIIPMRIEDDTLYIASHKGVSLPEILPIVRKYYGNYRIEIVKVGENDFEELFKKYFGARYNIDQIVNDILKRIDRNINVGEDRSIIDLVNHILYKAIEENASDVHVETGKSVTRIKFRIDGILRVRLVLPKKIHNSIIVRLKIMANLDISESRIPLDGHFAIKYGKREIDVRLATSPAVYGEIAVMRLLNIGGELPVLSKLGYSQKELQKLSAVAKQPYGIILATGPTGSGKTTTLYAMLDHVFSLKKCIVTIEDPPEIKWDLIRQIAVNERAGLTFEKALRSILRQDPDIILIGEIRDLTTADIAIKAAETGHLVLSTLHSNISTDAPYRLANMGVETASLGPALLGIIGQRLLRKICPACKYEYEADEEERQVLGLDSTEPVILAKGRGCMECNFTGYKGRVVVGEIFIPDQELQNDIVNLRSISAIDLRKKAIQRGMKPMYKDAVEKVLSKITTVDELVRVLRTNKGLA
ncbi:MAG: Flp pilus assembly complex ATPase component [Epsilonproteobacteria bacterium]|nr:type II secretion system protein GspE [Campylobacterota bacterium]NPA56399.1 Flp pilus assembly complex ATPase component [Campylobacterota bacterium]